jgi:two-component system LytT family response regulator
MIRTIIIDDEQKAIDSLQYLLNKYCPNISICATATTFEKAYQLVHLHKPNLVFSDVLLNATEGTGIDLINILKEKKTEVIFMSAFKDYAVDAFRVKAVDYLLKPINIEQLVDAVGKVANHKQEPGVKSYRSTIQIPTQQGFTVLKQEDIIHCEAQGPYTYFHTKDKKIISSENLGSVEQKLLNAIFFRVHKSHIINKLHITAYHRGDGGFVTMTDSSEVPVSRNSKDAFLEWLDK